MMRITRNSTWTLELDADGLECLANAIGVLEMFVTDDPSADVVRGEVKALMQNYEGRQGRFLMKLAQALHDELAREFPLMESPAADELMTS